MTGFRGQASMQLKAWMQGETGFDQLVFTF
jgi:hypothetical protein